MPHIKAENLKAVAFGLAWCELEDYGERVIRPLIDARGDLAKIDGYKAIDADFVRQISYQRTLATYHKQIDCSHDQVQMLLVKAVLRVLLA